LIDLTITGAGTVDSGSQLIGGSAIDRRTFCGCSLAAAALSSSAFGERADAEVIALRGSRSIYKVVFDTRYAAARAFAAETASRGIRITGIEGDVTALWVHDLRAHWAAGGCAVAGMTTERSLLCLEQLAHDTWQRVLARVQYRPGRSSSDARLVSWIIGS
jgi:hypothetical protein